MGIHEGVSASVVKASHCGYVGRSCRGAILLFLLSVASNLSIAAAAERPSSALNNTFAKLERGETLHVVVVGNSVSHGTKTSTGTPISYYHGLLEWIAQRFPHAEVELETKIIFAIGPESQLFWMDEDVISERPDLLVVEFGAANGAWGEAGRPVTDPATEGYIRRSRLMLPTTDCLINVGLQRNMMDDYRAGRTPGTAQFLHRVGEHYGCAVVDSGAELARRIIASEDWSAYMKDGIHPTPAGYGVHQQAIRRELDRRYEAFRQLEKKAQRTLRAHPLPAETLDRAPWWFPRRVPAYLAQRAEGFALAESGPVKYLEATNSQASGSFSVEHGWIVGLLTHHAAKGPAAESLEIRLDGSGPWTRLRDKAGPRFMRDDDRSNAYRRHFFAAYGLPLRAHELEWRVALVDGEKARTPGIFAFLVIEQMDMPALLQRPVSTSATTRRTPPSTAVIEEQNTASEPGR
jgi:lysophospholipase L1-like esterase